MWCQLSTWRAVYWLSANGWITVSIPCLCLCMVCIAGVLQRPPSPGEAGTAQCLPLPETEPGSCWHQMGELQIGIERGRSSLVRPLSFGYYSADRFLTTLYQFFENVPIKWELVHVWQIWWHTSDWSILCVFIVDCQVHNLRQGFSKISYFTTSHTCTVGTFQWPHNRTLSVCDHEFEMLRNSLWYCLY